MKRCAQHSAWWNLLLLAMLGVSLEPGCGRKPVPKDYSFADCVSLTLGKKNREDGLRQVKWDADGATTQAVVLGQECQSLKLARRQQACIYFALDPSFKGTNCPNVKVTVEYFAASQGRFQLEYDGRTAYTPAADPVTLRPTRSWETAQFTLTGARFENSQNGHADFRLRAWTPELFVRQVRVSRDNIGPEFPRHSRPSSASIILGRENEESGLQQVHDESDGLTVADTVGEKECRRLVSKQPWGAYIYFAIDPAFKETDPTNAVVTVEYCNAVRGHMEVQYYQGPRSARTARPPRNPVVTSLDWKTAEFELKGARFESSENSGGDFRIQAFGPGLYVRRVTLTWVKDFADAPVSALQDFLATQILPAAACGNCVDLSQHYNALLTESWIPGGREDKSLSTLPVGLQVFGGVTFDVRALIQLAGRALETRTQRYPRSVQGIKIDRKLGRLSFFQGCAWPVPDGTRIAQFTVHYSNQATGVIPVIYGAPVRNWWPSSGDMSGTNDAAWVGGNAASRAQKSPIRLYVVHWTNSLPDVPIKTLDYQSEVTDSAPFLIGISTDR